MSSTSKRGESNTGSSFFACKKITIHIIDIKELEVWEPMATSYPVEGEKPEMYMISSFLYFFFACKNYSGYNRKNGLIVNRTQSKDCAEWLKVRNLWTPCWKKAVYNKFLLFIFCRTQVTKGGGMVIELVIAGYILIFLLGVILGKSSET